MARKDDRPPGQAVATSTKKQETLTRELNPTPITLQAIVEGAFENETQYQISQVTTAGLTIDSFGYFRRDAKKLICLLPSAQPSAIPQQNPVFHRWSWFAHFPDCHILALSVMSRDVVLAPARNDTVPIQEVSVQTARH
ncbi:MULTISPECIES: hypothetical protein [Paenarthrobacter]|uniref:Uncharacterized protein n=1 Tax=Paenarthrobacter ureafaciens TaxID=37931 RepID=A0AAX3EF38_PAEUR|nr:MULTISPECIES: hypothetical protein [Paenarthrobacter]NKR14447.1 hypothetical protein [Arthrobacter sp. M6]MDO5865855.1 hypothetical protein [Paenarthrobacter sp. SD-2]MDO5876949.1 hypothetical protein [Paenarthrobacter sp. SD-1]UYV92159.1 hypothetical protein NL395_16780 [Paenarthrobacter ureafaciens]UYV96695.1 hypothetical protein NL394_16810 [Paenarthrobacter ureafaciens]